ncbi:MAG: DNA repair exonuclease [Clostridia bacterium]|nr:DNA repair exonuclease [Clostridia bacterium]
MKFVHIADMHFDIPFTSLNTVEDLGEKRRIEQRNAFKKVIEYIKQNNVGYLFIAGDLYEHDYVRESTIEYISKLFSQIPNCKIFITPGNHDPYIKNSYYDTYEFGDNVYIFRNARIEKYEDENVNIYGMAFTEFFMEESPLENLTLPFSNKPNILVAHCDLDGAKDKEGFSYNPILESKLNSLGFDYGALGHIHKNNLNNKNKIYYPGSTVALGFDELGEHGMIVGDITKERVNIDFIRLDERKFEEIQFKVDDFSSKEDLIDRILNLNLDDMNLYKLILIGNRNFEINTREILRVVARENVLKIKDCTKINYDLEELSKQKNLKGIFIKEVLDMYNKGLCTEEEYQKAIEIGLEAM